jgi:hypothetical protein
MTQVELVKHLRTVLKMFLLEAHQNVDLALEPRLTAEQSVLKSFVEQFDIYSAMMLAT